MSSQSPLRGTLLKMAGFAAAIVAVVGFIAGRFAGEAGLPYAVFIATGVGALFGALSFASSGLFIRGKKHHAISAREKTAADPRPPVLYFRSFKDEALDAERLTPRVAFIPSFVTQEERLVEVLEEIGPTVALGEPGETLPELGAARLYVEHSDWRTSVTELMKRAALVLIRAGRSESLLWEEERALRHLRPERVAFVIPDDAATYQALRSRLRLQKGLHLPEFQGWEESDSGRLRAILYFEPGWSPRMRDLAFLGDDVNLKTPLRKALAPVIRQIKSLGGST